MAEPISLLRRLVEQNESLPERIVRALRARDGGTDAPRRQAPADPQGATPRRHAPGVRDPRAWPYADNSVPLAPPAPVPRAPSRQTGVPGAGYAPRPRGSAREEGAFEVGGLPFSPVKPGVGHPDMYGATQGLLGAAAPFIPLAGKIADLMGKVRHLAEMSRNFSDTLRGAREEEDEARRPRKRPPKPPAPPIGIGSSNPQQGWTFDAPPPKAPQMELDGPRRGGPAPKTGLAPHSDAARGAAPAPRTGLAPHGDAARRLRGGGAAKRTALAPPGPDVRAARAAAREAGKSAREAAREGRRAAAAAQREARAAAASSAREAKKSRRRAPRTALIPGRKTKFTPGGDVARGAKRTKLMPAAAQASPVPPAPPDPAPPAAGAAKSAREEELRSRLGSTGAEGQRDDAVREQTDELRRLNARLEAFEQAVARAAGGGGKDGGAEGGPDPLSAAVARAAPKEADGPAPTQPKHGTLDLLLML